MKKIILLVLLFIPIIGSSQNNRVIDWYSDLNFLRVELPKNHYNLYSVKSEKDYFAGIEQLSQDVNKISDFSIAIKMQQLIATFGDSHTMVAWSQFADNNKILPLNLLYFQDGLYIINTTEENKSILGSKILKINGTPLAKITDSLKTLVTVDNNAIIKTVLPKLILYVQLLEHFGFIKTDVIDLLLENQNGESLTYSIKPGVMTKQNRRSFMPDSIALCYRNGRSLFIDTILRKDNTYYIQYNMCASRELPPQGFQGNPELLPSFNDFKKKIIETINNNDFDKVVFDIRFNGGGNSAPGTELIREMSTIKKINKKGKLFVIIGRETFSSAIINAMDFKNMTQAIFVGEETSGKPNHFGEIRLFQLPSSGLKIQYSTNYFKNSALDINTITPDHIVDVTFKEFKNGCDPVYDWIIKQ
ncbi:MAG: S41 family peptidase [Bacteroidales bacterium]|nr:S41 family peptidase [Bacteroidales bacterium]